MRQRVTVHRLFAITLLMALTILSTSAASAQGVAQPERHWISLGPKHETASAGDTVTYVVGVGTSATYFSGEVLVTIPSGLTVDGQPFCSSGCWQPSVQQGQTGSQIQTPITVRTGESVSFSFNVQIDPTVALGTTFQLTAFLLGGVNTAGSSETAFATLQVTGSYAASASSNTNLHLDDEPPISFEPETLSVSPGDTARITITLFESLAEYRLSVVVPQDLVVLSEPVCVGSDAELCTDGIYDKSVSTLANGSSEVTVIGTSVIRGKRKFVIHVEIPSHSSKEQYVVNGTLESVRRWGLEPIGEASIVITIESD